MNLCALSDEFNKALSKSIILGGHEPKIIHNFVNHVQQIKPLKKNHIKINIRTGFIHQKPYVYFIAPNDLCGRKKCEIGDVAYVLKRKQNGKLKEIRVTFGQIKLIKNDVAKIEPHQLKFYVDINMLKIRFGNTLSKQANISRNEFYHLSRSSWFGHYLLLSQNREYVCRPSLIETHYGFDCHSFSFCVVNYYKNPLLPNVYGLFTYQNFLQSFFQRNGIGASISKKMENFLKVIYKKMGWQNDPPEEIEEYFLNSDNGGFGLIEITIDIGNA